MIILQIVLNTNGSTQELLLACYRKDTKSLKSYMSSYKYMLVNDSMGFGAAHYCVMADWFDGLRLILREYSLSDEQSIEGYTALHLASFIGNSSCAELLLENTADPDLVTKRGFTALFFAAQRGLPSLGCLQILLLMGRRKIKVNRRNNFNSTALQVAVECHGDREVVRLLLSSGADHSFCNIKGTPLHTCARLGRLEAMKQLLAAGADPNAPDPNGHSALQNIFLPGHPGRSPIEEYTKQEMIKALKRSGAALHLRFPRDRNYSILHYAFAACRDAATVELLLEGAGAVKLSGTEVNMILDMRPYRKKETMLHVAARKGWATLIPRLVEAGAALEMKSPEGLTPLHLAVIYERDSAVRALLIAGADRAALGPDIYPSFSVWKVRRGMKTVRALMQTENQGQMEVVMAQLSQPEEILSALDMALTVSRHVPCIEALLEQEGKEKEEEDRTKLYWNRVLTGERLTAMGKPLLLMLANREWTSHVQHSMPSKFKNAAREALKCLSRSQLPPNVMLDIIAKAALPVTQWADGEWIRRTSLAQTSTSGGVDMEEGVGLPGFHIHVAGPGAAALPPMAMDEVMTHVMQHIQDHLMAAGAPGELEIPPLDIGLLAPNVDPRMPAMDAAAIGGGGQHFFNVEMHIGGPLAGLGGALPNMAFQDMLPPNLPPFMFAPMFDRGLPWDDDDDDDDLMYPFELERIGPDDYGVPMDNSPYWEPGSSSDPFTPLETGSPSETDSQGESEIERRGPYWQYCVRNDASPSHPEGYGWESELLASSEPDSPSEPGSPTDSERRGRYWQNCVRNDASPSEPERYPLESELASDKVEEGHDLYLTNRSRIANDEEGTAPPRPPPVVHIQHRGPTTRSQTQMAPPVRIQQGPTTRSQTRMAPPSSVPHAEKMARGKSRKRQRRQ